MVKVVERVEILKVLGRRRWCYRLLRMRSECESEMDERPASYRPLVAAESHLSTRLKYESEMSTTRMVDGVADGGIPPVPGLKWLPRLITDSDILEWAMVTVSMLQWLPEPLVIDSR